MATQRPNLPLNDLPFNLTKPSNGAPTSIPQYLHEDPSRSTESTGSCDSMMTQVPLPYHTSTDPSSAPSSRASQGEGGLPDKTFKPWGTPDLSAGASGAFADTQLQRPRTGSLNPSSSAFVPITMAGGNQYHSVYAGGAQGYHGGYDMNGDMGGGYVPNQFSPSNGMNMNMGGMHGGPVGGFIQAPPFVPFQTPDMSYTMPVPSSAYPVGMPVMNPPPAFNNYGGNSSYGGYGGMSQQMYPAGMAHSPAYGQGGEYNGGYNGPAYNANYQQPSNVNRGKSGWTPKDSQAKTPAQVNYGRATSNLATAPVQLANGGAVQPPAKSTIPPTESTESTASTQESSAKDAIETRSEGATPVEKDAADSFHSEQPQGLETPTLQSRRKQPASNPGVLTEWLEGVENANVNGASKPQPPPKMMDLVPRGGSGRSSLNENDPFGGSPVGIDRTPKAAGPFNLWTSPPPFISPTQALLPYYVCGVTPASSLLKQLTANGTRTPTYDEATENKFFPFMEICRAAKSDSFGVIRIKNIPYSVNRQEILAFLGRNARLVNERDHEPVHIVMERVTSKTLDCFIEFTSFHEAVNAVNRFETNRQGGRAGRLGQRHVEIELSSQDQLMKELFPKAKNVEWRDGRPFIKPSNPEDPYNSGFQGFISKEELVMLVKHVEAPQRSPFSKDCPQRPFECLISTLVKYPWYMVEYITIQDRIELHKTTMRLIQLLKERVESTNEDLNMSNALFTRVVRAAVQCVGFTPTMKDDIVGLSGIDDSKSREYGVPQYAWYWHPFWTLAPKRDFPQDVVLYFAALIREAVEGSKRELTLAERAAQGEQDAEAKLFGDIRPYFDYPENFAYANLEQMAKAEWAGVELLLKQALTPRLTQ